MNEPQQPPLSNSDPAFEQADLHHLDDLLDDLLNLQQEPPEHQSQSLVAEKNEQSESQELNPQKHAKAERPNVSVLEPSDSFLSPFLASREDRGIPEFEISQPDPLPDTLLPDTDQPEIIRDFGLQGRFEAPIMEQSELNCPDSESGSQVLPDESYAPMIEPLNNTELADQDAQEIPQSKPVDSGPILDTQVTQIEDQAKRHSDSNQSEIAEPQRGRLNVRPIEQASDTAEKDTGEDFRNALLQAPFVSALNAEQSSAFHAEPSSATETPDYQAMHHAISKQSKRPFLASSKLWLVLALVGLGAGGGVAIWQKLNQPRVSFSLTGQDLGTDFLEPDPFTSASPANDASVLPSAEISRTAESVSPTASAIPSAKPSVMVSAPTELLLWARVNQASVNIRSAPSKQANIVLQPKINQKFILTGQSKRADDLDWAEIQLDESKTAWVSTKFIEIMPGEKVASKPSPAASSAPTEASEDEYAQAAKVVAQLLKAPGTAWPQASPELQNLTVLAMLKQIFKDKPDDVSPERIATLQSCLDESVRAENLKKLKVYEIAVACTLALNWR